MVCWGGGWGGRREPNHAGSGHREDKERPARHEAKPKSGTERAKRPTTAGQERGGGDEENNRGARNGAQGREQSRGAKPEPRNEGAGDTTGKRNERGDRQRGKKGTRGTPGQTRGTEGGKRQRSRQGHAHGTGGRQRPGKGSRISAQSTARPDRPTGTSKPGRKTKHTPENADRQRTTAENRNPTGTKARQTQ